MKTKKRATHYCENCKCSRRETCHCMRKGEVFAKKPSSGSGITLTTLAVLGSAFRKKLG